MLTVDTKIWRNTEFVNTVYPEIKFIEYNQTSEDHPSQMGPGSHVDNRSIVTAVFMLSETEAHEGGIFDIMEQAGLNDESNGPGQPPDFEIRDCVVFRGDMSAHRVTPITKGTGIFLQIELHSSSQDRGVDEDEDYYYDDDDDEEDRGVDEDEDYEDEDEDEYLERTGKLYNLPKLLEREDTSMEQSKWIVNRLTVDETGRASTFVKVPDCLSLSQWEDLLSLQPLLKSDLLMDDRAEETEYYHVVHRVESILKQNFSNSSLYEGLIGKMQIVDAENWKVLEDVTTVYPEIEFIVYNRTLEGQRPKMGFGSHVDNGSVLTAVFMLSDRTDFEGGSLMFARDIFSDIGDAVERPANFSILDCAVFRGEKLSHWVTPVTKGTRKVLQIELHLSFEDRGSDDDEQEGDEDDEDFYDEEDWEGYEEDYEEGYEEDYEEDYEKDYEEGYEEDYEEGYEKDEWCDEGDNSCFEEED